jgi:hypothetical protein
MPLAIDLRITRVNSSSGSMALGGANNTQVNGRHLPQLQWYRNVGSGHHPNQL